MNDFKNLPETEIRYELQRGGRVVSYQYCISVILISFRRSSKLFLIREGESKSAKGLPYTLLSCLLGWWGIPWGPIWTVSTIVKNFRGGIDVTDEIMNALHEANRID